MKILIVGPSWVGDAVMAQTLFKLIKEKNNNTVIDVLAPSWALSVFKRMKEINQIIEMPFGHGEIRLKERRSFGLVLKINKYDQAIVLPNSLKSSLIPFFADIPIRTGWRGELRYFFLNDIRKLIADNSVSDYSELFRLLYDSIDDYGQGKEPECILAIAGGQHQDVNVVDKEINVIFFVNNFLNESMAFLNHKISSFE